MSTKWYSYLTLLCCSVLLVSCSSETRNYQLHLDDRTQVTYSEIRTEVSADKQTLQRDIGQRLDVLKVFIDDMMEEYRTADEQRRKKLQPKVQKLRSLIGEVRGSLKTYAPEGEKLSETQQKQIINKMQELRSTYQDLVTHLGITWH
jgi:hypothetical protein